MAKGEHLFASYGLYTHHGIDMGDGTVVELSKEKGGVHRVSLSDFSGGNTVHVRDYSDCDPVSIVLDRVREKLGEKGYNLFTNNCEHFATWCKTGRQESAQVQTIKKASGKAAATLATFGAKEAVKLASKTGSKALTRTATPWLLASDAAQLVTEWSANNLGADPKVAENVGRGVGAATSIGIGAAVGGPVGALVGAGVWAIGEVVGALF